MHAILACGEMYFKNQLGLVTLSWPLQVLCGWEIVHLLAAWRMVCIGDAWFIEFCTRVFDPWSCIALNKMKFAQMHGAWRCVTNHQISWMAGIVLSSLGMVERSIGTFYRIILYEMTIYHADKFSWRSCWDIVCTAYNKQTNKQIPLIPVEIEPFTMKSLILSLSS